MRSSQNAAIAPIVVGGRALGKGLSGWLVNPMLPDATPAHATPLVLRSTSPEGNSELPIVVVMWTSLSSKIVTGVPPVAEMSTNPMIAGVALVSEICAPAEAQRRQI